MLLFYILLLGGIFLKRVLIVGNCISAVSAAEAFRKHDTKTPITIISKEPHLAYYRLQLSNFLGKDPDINNLLIKKPEWYKKNNIEVLLSTKVKEIVPEENLVKLDNKEKISFSKLLLANGSSPFMPPVPGNKKKGVFTIRTINDVKELYNFTKDKSRGIIIGGGVLGLEAAWGLAQNQKNVTVIERGEYILSRQLDKRASNLLKTQGEKNNVKFITSKNVVSIDGENSVQAITLDDGKQIPADFVIFSTGVRPNLDIVKGLPIDCNRGIVVNEYMETSVENIYAAGDVAEYQGLNFGIWPVASQQGKIAGLNMANIKTPYEKIAPSNYIRVFDINIFSIGNIKDKRAQSIYDIDPENKTYRCAYIKDNHIIGANLLSDTKPAVKISKAIKSKKIIPDEIIKNNNFKELIKYLQ